MGARTNRAPIVVRSHQRPTTERTYRIRGLDGTGMSQGERASVRRPRPVAGSILLTQEDPEQCLGLSLRWAVLGSNQRPLPCQGSALPLRQPPRFLLWNSFAIRKDLPTSTEVTTGFEPVYTALQAVASPLGHATACGSDSRTDTPTRADDEIRTRDPHLGKVMRYHCATSALPAFLRAR